MKKVISILLALCVMLCFAACGPEESGSDLPEGELTLTTPIPSKDGHPAALAMDGDISTGWIGGRSASEDNSQILNIDLGKKTTFSRITIDDSFTAGYTKRKPDFVLAKASFDMGSMTSWSGNTAVSNLVTGTADGLGWTSENVPTTDAPEKICLTLSSAVKVKKIVFDNDMGATVPVDFDVYYSADAVDVENSDVGMDADNYTKLLEVRDNAETICEKELSEEITVRSLLVVFFSQTREDGETGASIPCEAMLDEIFFYAATPENYTEPHQPVWFILKGSNDGNVYEDIAEELGNYNNVWVKELSAPVTYRFIRYLVYEEAGDNRPSIGEIKFE